MAARSRYVGVDVGGTFTDVVVYDELSSKVEVIKVPTTPKNPEEAILDAMSEFKMEADAVTLINHATTIATNALLTMSGLTKTALITNRGFRDILEIGRQKRAEIYNIRNQRPHPLVKRADRFGVKGRIAADGRQLQPLDAAEVKRLAKRLVHDRFESVAVGFLNSYVNDRHERRVEAILRREGFGGHISLSSNVNREYREYERISSAVVNAGLAPLLSIYLAKLEENLKTVGFNAPLFLMTSDGNVSTAKRASMYPISVIESGPAAGVLACADLSARLGLSKVATFDMGGTTAKAGMLIDSQPDVSYEFEAAGKTHSGRSIKGSGYPVRFPFIDLAEVSAGGGTIAWVDDGGSLRLGPLSAGAVPGPAAYGRGGDQPTVTDANILLGRLSSSHLLGGKMKLYPALAAKAVNERVADKLGVSPNEAAESIIRVVNHNMAKAISIVSIERGRDPREFVMIAFGGAGPLHACDLADENGMKKIVFPPHSGLFSAYGLLTVDLARIISRPIMSTNLDVHSEFSELEAETAKALKEEGFERFDSRKYIDLRYKGQSFQLTLPYLEGGDLRVAFDEQHKALYGYASTDPIEAVNIKLRAVVPMPKITPDRKTPESRPFAPEDSREVWFRDTYATAPVYLREKLWAGAAGKGPCIVEEYDSTTVINPGWAWQIDEFGDIQAERIR